MSENQQGRGYDTATSAGAAMTIGKVDNKSVVHDERQPLLDGPVVRVTEVFADVLEDSPTDPDILVDSDRQKFGFTAMLLRLFFPFFLYCLAVGAVTTPKITIILAMMCRKASPNGRQGSIQNDDVCAVPSIHVEMSHFMIYANLISGTLCALCGPQLCRWSDRHGRKPLIAVSVVGMLLGDLMSMIAASFPEQLSVQWILLEFVVGGLTGAFLTTMALVQSYVADVTSQEQRTTAFGILHACMYLGLGIGPGVGALYIRLVGKGDMLSVFLAAGVFHLLFVLYVLILIPESVSAAVRKAKDHKAKQVDFVSARAQGGRLFHFANPLKIFSHCKDEGKASCLIILRTLAGIDLLAFGVQIGLQPLLVIYSQFRFNWKTVEASYFLSVTNMTRGIVLAVFLPFGMLLMRTSLVTKSHRIVALKSSVDVSDCRSYMHIIRGSILLEIVGQAGFAISKASTPFTISGIVAASGAPISPVTQSLMTLYVDPDRWGELFGAVCFLHSVARAFVPALMQLVYGLTVQSCSSVIFWGLSTIFGGALLASCWIGPRKQPLRSKRDRVEV